MKPRFEKLKGYVERFENIADLGIGKGYYYVGAKVKKVVGVDLNQGNLEKVSQHSPHITLIFADVRKTGLPDKEYDLVLCTQVIEHFQNYWEVVKEIDRICKDKGSILISVPIEEHHSGNVHPVWSEEMVKEVGNRLGEIVEFSKEENYWLMFVQKC